MNDEAKKNLVDIVQAAQEIETFVRGMDFKTYQASLLTQRAVERNFEIIGEALGRVRNLDKEALEQISEHQRIIGFRNILIHGYDVVDEQIVWTAVQKHLPTLTKEVERMLED